MNYQAQAYSHLSIELRVEAEGVSYTTDEVDAVDYDDGQEPGELRGTSSEILGRTRGDYKPTGKMTLSKKAHNELLAKFGKGFYMKVFTVVVAHQEPGLDLIVDTLQGCRMQKNTASSKQGNDPNKVEVELNPMKILWNGIDGSAVEET